MSKANGVKNGMVKIITWLLVVLLLLGVAGIYNFDISKETPVSKHTGKLQEKPLTLIPIVDDGESPF